MSSNCLLRAVHLLSIFTPPNHHTPMSQSITHTHIPPAQSSPDPLNFSTLNSIDPISHNSLCHVFRFFHTFVPNPTRSLIHPHFLFFFECLLLFSRRDAFRTPLRLAFLSNFLSSIFFARTWVIFRKKPNMVHFLDFLKRNFAIFSTAKQKNLFVSFSTTFLICWISQTHPPTRWVMPIKFRYFHGLADWIHLTYLFRGQFFKFFSKFYFP